MGQLFFQENGNYYQCSGALINKNTILTTAHCVYGGNGGQAGWASTINFLPGRSNATVKPFGEIGFRW